MKHRAASLTLVCCLLAVACAGCSKTKPVDRCDPPSTQLWKTYFHAVSNHEYYKLVKQRDPASFCCHDRTFRDLWEKLTDECKKSYDKADCLTDTEIKTRLRTLNETEAAIELLEGDEYDHDLMHEAYGAACKRLGVEPVKKHEPTQVLPEPAEEKP